MKFRDLTVSAVALILLAGQAPAMIPEPPGQEPAASDARFDAVCAVGKAHRMTGATALDWIDENGNFNPLRSGGNTGSGTLIAPNLVLTAKHLFPSGWACDIDGYLCTPAESCDQNRKWVVRFRKNPDGTVGTMEEFPHAPNTVRGPDSFFHVNVIGAIDFVGCEIDSVILILENDVTHIDPMPVLGDDHRRFQYLGFNESRHPEGANNTHDRVDIYHDFIVSGWGSTVQQVPGVVNAGGSGQIRIREGIFGHYTDFFANASGFATAWTGSVRPLALHDSGMPALVVNEDNSLSVVMNVNGGIGNDLVFYSGGKRVSRWLNPPQINHLVASPSMFDVTGSAIPGDTMYGIWDGVVRVDDVLYVAAETILGNLDVDFTGSSDPQNPGYGIPDGTADSTDYDYFIDLLYNRSVNDLGPWPSLPLPAGNADNTGDDRFSVEDYDSVGLSTTDLSKYDFNRDGTFSKSEKILAGSINGDFGHGLVADLNGDGAHDAADVSAIIALLATGNPWDNHAAGDAEYNVLLDSNLDGHTTHLDRSDIAAFLLPGEIDDAANAFDSFAGSTSPDFSVSRWDRLSAFNKAVQLTPGGSGTFAYLDTTGSADPESPQWGVPDEVTDIKDFKHFLWRQFEVFGPDGEHTDPDVAVRMWPAFDADGDGRLTFEDYFYLQDVAPGSFDAAHWDLDNDGVFEPYDQNITFSGDDTLPVFRAVFNYGWDQNHLGDYDGDMNPSDCCQLFGTFEVCAPFLCVIDGDPAPDCDDYFAIYEELNCNSNNLFDGRSFFSDTDEGYMPAMDADLDGDNDLDDQYMVIAHGLGLPDYNLDSVINADDVNLFLALYNAQDPAADLVGPNGSFDFLDISEFLTRFSANTCGWTSPLPRPCTIPWP